MDLHEVLSEIEYFVPEIFSLYVEEIISDGTSGTFATLDDSISEFIEPYYILHKGVKILYRNENEIALPTSEANFVSEVLALQKLKEIGTPHVPIICGWSFNEECYYILMERINGKSFTDWVSLKRRTDEEIYQIGLQLLIACQEIHKLGLAHRDIKPDNIIIEEYEEDNKINYRVVLLDLGLACSDKILGIRLSTGIVGAVRYRSPERFLEIPDSQLPVASDYWAVGVTLMYLITGREFDNLHRCRAVNSVTLKSAIISYVDKEFHLPDYPQTSKIFCATIVANPLERIVKVAALLDSI